MPADLIWRRPHEHPGNQRAYHDFSGLAVLFGVHLQVKEGERHAVIGPNGAGKTTLFNIDHRHLSPSQGDVFFNGKNITGARPYQLTRLGMGRSFRSPAPLIE